MFMEQSMTTEELANMWKPPTPGESAEDRKNRFRRAAAWVRRRGVIPLEWRTTDGQRLWPRDRVMEEMKERDRRGNRTSGDQRRGGRPKRQTPK